MALLADDPVIAHDALSVLINLSADPDILQILASTDNSFLYRVLLMVWGWSGLVCLPKQSRS